MRNTAERIYVNGVRESNRYGVVDVVFMETILDGKQNMKYMRTFLERKGYRVREGHGIPNTPFLSLSISRDGAIVAVREIRETLRADPEFRVPGIP